MRAVVMREFGPPEVLEPVEVDEVRAGPGEVVIEAEFANVTFVETQIRQAGRRILAEASAAHAAIEARATVGKTLLTVPR